jgi:hypothetical protein
MSLVVASYEWTASVELGVLCNVFAELRYNLVYWVRGIG